MAILAYATAFLTVGFFVFLGLAIYARVQSMKAERDEFGD